MSGDNVFLLDPKARRTDRPPPLTEAEVLQLRAMLREFQAIKQSCPMARMLTRDD